MYVSSSEQCLVDCLCVSALLSMCGGLFVSFSEQCLVDCVCQLFWAVFGRLFACVSSSEQCLVDCLCVSALLSSVWWIVCVCQLF